MSSQVTPFPLHLSLSSYEDALDIVWGQFAQRPSLPLYQKLQQQAEKHHDWLDWREQAIDYLYQNAEKSQSPTFGGRLYGMSAGYSTLVEIYLWEGAVDQAWEAAQAGGCSPQLWMKLADLRAAEHPEDALSVYLPRIKPLIDQTNNDSYQQAVALLAKVKGLMHRLDRAAEFDTLLTSLSTEYKRKRNFIKYLLERGLL